VSGLGLHASECGAGLGGGRGESREEAGVGTDVGRVLHELLAHDPEAEAGAVQARFDAGGDVGDIGRIEQRHLVAGVLSVFAQLADRAERLVSHEGILAVLEQHPDLVAAFAHRALERPSGDGFHEAAFIGAVDFCPLPPAGEVAVQLRPTAVGGAVQQRPGARRLKHRRRALAPA
jgi:hypothetical protein